MPTLSMCHLGLFFLVFLTRHALIVIHEEIYKLYTRKRRRAVHPALHASCSETATTPPNRLKPLNPKP